MSYPYEADPRSRNIPLHIVLADTEDEGRAWLAEWSDLLRIDRAKVVTPEVARQQEGLLPRVVWVLPAAMSRPGFYAAMRHMRRSLAKLPNGRIRYWHAPGHLWTEV